MRARWLTLAALVAACSTSDGGGPELPDAGLDDVARAESLLAETTSLPRRPEVVALTDRLSIAADSATGEPRARLAWLAGQLRERVWRLDGAATDAREAVELYGRVVEHGEGDMACLADARRARVAAELTADPGLAFRETYRAIDRHGDGGEAVAACLASMRATLSIADAYRPTGAAWQALLQGTAPTVAATATATAPSPSPVVGDSKAEIVVVPEAALVTGDAELEGVQPYSYDAGGRVVLKLNAPARYEVGELAPDPGSGRGHRIYLDLLRTKPKGKKWRTVEASGLVERVRVGKRGDATRVVLDLAEDVRRRVFYLPDPFRVVIDVNKDRPEVSAAAPKPGAERAVTRVTLDPGHGGWDSGAVGPTGLQEKDVALDIAHRAAPTLASELGIETMLTRDKDVYVDLEERTARANAFQSDLFVSIHCNATENGQATGVEVFILDPGREVDRRALRVLARENHGKAGGMDPKLLDAQVSSVVAGLGAGVIDQSRTLADLLLTSTMASLKTRYPDTHDHGVKTAGFYVLVGANMPAVLYETSFISNPDDEARLGTADYRQKLADAIVNAVRAYRGGIR